MEQILNKSQHRKLSLEKKILPLFLPGFELATFCSQVWCCTNKLSQLLVREEEATTTTPIAVSDWLFVSLFSRHGSCLAVLSQSFPAMGPAWLFCLRVFLLVLFGCFVSYFSCCGSCLAVLSHSFPAMGPVWLFCLIVFLPWILFGCFVSVFPPWFMLGCFVSGCSGHSVRGLHSPHKLPGCCGFGVFTGSAALSC